MKIHDVNNSGDKTAAAPVEKKKLTEQHEKRTKLRACIAKPKMVVIAKVSETREISIPHTQTHSHHHVNDNVIIFVDCFMNTFTAYE